MKNQQASRRNFLKGSAVAAAGTALAGNLGLARSVHAAGVQEMKVALIGAGGRGTGAAHDILTAAKDSKIKITVTAVADAFEDKAKNAAKNLRGAEEIKAGVNITDDRIFWGLDSYQKAIDSGVDMVLLASPPGFRPYHYKAAVEAGKHVFMEKPCCVDAPGFRSLMETNELADKKGLKVGVGLQRHHDLGYQETVKRIHDGAIGKIQFQHVYWNSSGVWVRPRKPGQTEMQYQVDNWYYFVWLCGDHICEQHIHNLDVANWVYNKDGDWKQAHPVSAHGMGGRQVRRGKDVGHIYDHHAVEFTYADGSRVFSQCRHIPQCWDAVNERAVGTSGSSNCCTEITGQKKWRYKGQRPNPYVHEHVELLKAIETGAKYNEGWMGAVSSFTAVLGRMATYSGKIVHWDDAVKNGPSEMPKQFTWDAEPPVKPDADGSYEKAVAVPGQYKPY